MKLQKLFFPAALVAAAYATFAMAAVADGEGWQVKPVMVRTAVMGPTVKNAPYSGEEVNTSDQVLGDGTHIHNETRTKVARDSEGRVRRETDGQVQIFDPVAGTSYVLNTKTLTASKITLSAMKGQAEARAMFTVSSDGVGSGVASGITTSTVRVENKGSGGGGGVGSGVGVIIADEPGVLAKLAAEDQLKTFTTNLTYSRVDVKTDGKGEKLPSQVIEGVLADGTRSTNVIKAGTIGNDRDLTLTSERWMSPDLKTLMMSEHSDPRTGKETFRLTGVSRNEPDPSLFVVPAEYKTNGK